MAFTVHGVHDLPHTLAAAGGALPRDYKNSARGIDPKALAYLAGSQRFTFAFMLPKRRKIIQDLISAQRSIDSTRQMFERFEDAHRFTADINRWRALRQEANSNNFPIKLYGDMILAAALAGAIGTLLAGEGRAYLLNVIPDRDSMNEWYDRLFFSVWSHDVWAFSMLHRYPPIALGYCFDKEAAPGANTWFDPLIRQDDYIAGTLASWDLQSRTASKPARDYPIIQQVIADNPNLAIFTLPNLDRGNPGCGRLFASRRPIPAAKSSASVKSSTRCVIP
jgi:hypothetical protein